MFAVFLLSIQAYRIQIIGKYTPLNCNYGIYTPTYSYKFFELTLDKQFFYEQKVSSLFSLELFIQTYNDQDAVIL